MVGPTRSRCWRSCIRSQRQLGSSLAVSVCQCQTYETTLLLNFIVDFELRLLLYYSTLVIISEGGGEELHAACNRTWRVNIRAGVQQQSTYVTVVTRSHSHGTHARKHDATRLDTENDSWPLSSSAQEVQSLRHLLASTFNVSTYHQGRLSYRWWYQPRTMWFDLKLT